MSDDAQKRIIRAMTLAIVRRNMAVKRIRDIHNLALRVGSDRSLVP